MFGFIKALRSQTRIFMVQVDLWEKAKRSKTLSAIEEKKGSEIKLSQGSSWVGIAFFYFKV